MSVKADLQVGQRPEITWDEMRNLLRMSWGDRGIALAHIWRGINEECFGGGLAPVPIWLPSSPPYGRWWGLCTHDGHSQVHHIQLKRGLELQEQADVILHEMVHQCLVEAGEKPGHNEQPWCNEIMRLSAEIWGLDKVWASPYRSRRGQKGRHCAKPPSTDHRVLSQAELGNWPFCLRVSIDYQKYLDRRTCNCEYVPTSQTLQTHNL